MWHRWRSGSLRIVEFLDSAHEADISFLDQILEGQTAVEMFLGHRDNKAQVAGDQEFLGFFVAFRNPFGNVIFLLGIQQRYSADFPEINLD